MLDLFHIRKEICPLGTKAIEIGPSLVHPADEALYRKIARRLIPFLFICYLIAQVDRMNIGFAKLTMLSDLGLSDVVYGIGAGIFFVGYVLFEVPSNLVMKRVGAHLWIGRIMITWGLLAAATMFVTSARTFCLVRFLLGVAEAGFFPGVIYYLTDWFTAVQRTRMTAIFMTAIAVSGVVVGPVSGLILQKMGGISSLHGWQWLFLLEGLPAVVLGITAIWFLAPSPEHAAWLTEEEKRRLAYAIAADHEMASDVSLSGVLASGRVWALSLIYGCYGLAFFGFVFWLPTIVRLAGVTRPFNIGLITAIPWTVGAITMVLAAGPGGRAGNVRWALILLALVSAAGWGLSPLAVSNLPLAMILLSLAMGGLIGSMPVFWNLPTAMFRGTSSAAAIAMITALGNLPGFLSPYLVAWIRQKTGSFDLPMYAFAGAMTLAALVVAALKTPQVSLRQLLDKREGQAEAAPRSE
jgi:MFS family permease